MLAAAVLSVAGVSSISKTANAQLFWDRNGTTAGAGTTPTGTWDTTLESNWNSVSAGTNAPGLWAGGNIAVFSAGTDGTGAFTVTVPTGVTIPGVTGINHNQGTLTLNGPGTITLTGAANLGHRLGL